MNANGRSVASGSLAPERAAAERPVARAASVVREDAGGVVPRDPGQRRGLPTGDVADARAAEIDRSVPSS
jgi:hypothetical protein